MQLTKKVRFCASHRLFNPEFTDEENLEIFGVCSNFNGHGHNYELAVTLTGEPDEKTGMILDLKRLKDLVIKEVIDELDHKALCKSEQQYLLKAIQEDLDLTDHLNDAMNSLRIVLAADESIKTGRTIAL